MKNWSTTTKWVVAIVVVIAIVAIYMNWSKISSMWSSGNTAGTTTRKFRTGGSIGGFQPPVGGSTPPSGGGTGTGSIVPVGTVNQIATGQVYSVDGQYSNCDAILNRINALRNDNNGIAHKAELIYLIKRYNYLGCKNVKLPDTCTAWIATPAGSKGEHELWLACSRDLSRNN